MFKVNLTHKIPFAFIIMVFLSQNLSAQKSIDTARPTLSIGPRVLPENSFQWEQGFQNIDGSQDLWFYDALFRASVSKSAELRILVPTLEHRFAILGVKWMMIQPEGNKPGIGFLINMGTKSNQNEQGENFKILEYRVAINKKLTDSMVGFFNAGYISSGYFADLTLAYGLGDKITVVGEYWYHQNWQQVQTAVTYLINNETQIDINGGLLFNAESDYTIGVGFARRFKYNGFRKDN